MAGDGDGDGDGDWLCAACTFVNTDDGPSCGVCDAARPAGALTAQKLECLLVGMDFPLTEVRRAIADPSVGLDPDAAVAFLAAAAPPPPATPSKPPAQKKRPRPPAAAAEGATPSRQRATAAAVAAGHPHAAASSGPPLDSAAAAGGRPAAVRVVAFREHASFGACRVGGASAGDTLLHHFARLEQAYRSRLPAGLLADPAVGGFDLQGGSREAALTRLGQLFDPGWRKRALGPEKAKVVSQALAGRNPQGQCWIGWRKSGFGDTQVTGPRPAVVQVSRCKSHAAPCDCLGNAAG